MAYRKGNLEFETHTLLPLTTSDQVIIDESTGARLSGVGVIAEPVDNSPLKVASINADLLGGRLPEYYKTRIDLLWENPNDDAEFPGQNVYGNFGDYNFLIFITNHYKHAYNGDKYKTSTFLPFIEGEEYWLVVPGWTTAVRSLVMYSDHILFNGGAYYQNFANTNYTTNPSHPTPWRIYGVKV